MAELSINEMTTFRWTFDEDVANYAAAGVRAIGVWRQKLADYGEERGIELLRDSGLRVSNLLWAGGFTGCDGRNFQESLDDAADAVRLCAALDCRCLVIYTGGRAGHTHNHARRLTREAFRKLLPWAEEHNVVLAVEPMHPGCAAEWTFLTDLDEALALVDAVASPLVKVVFDTYHLGHDARILALLPRIAPHVAVVHLGDGKTPPDREQDRCRLGEGRIPLRELIAGLRQGGFDGDYDLELLGEEIEAADYHELIDSSRRTYDALVV